MPRKRSAYDGQTGKGNGFPIYLHRKLQRDMPKRSRLHQPRDAVGNERQRLFIRLATHTQISKRFLIIYLHGQPASIMWLMFFIIPAAISGRFMV